MYQVTSDVEFCFWPNPETCLDWRGEILAEIHPPEPDVGDRYPIMTDLEFRNIKLLDEDTGQWYVMPRHLHHPFQEWLKSRDGTERCREWLLEEA